MAASVFTQLYFTHVRTFDACYIRAETPMMRVFYNMHLDERQRYIRAETPMMRTFIAAVYWLGNQYNQYLPFPACKSPLW